MKLTIASTLASLFALVTVASAADVRYVQVTRSLLRSGSEPLADSVAVVPLGAKVQIAGAAQNDYLPVDLSALTTDNPQLTIEIRKGVNPATQRTGWIPSTDLAASPITLEKTGAARGGVVGSDVAAFRGVTEGSVLPVKARGSLIPGLSEGGYHPQVEANFRTLEQLTNELTIVDRMQSSPSYRNDPFQLSDQLTRFGYTGHLALAGMARPVRPKRGTN